MKLVCTSDLHFGSVTHSDTIKKLVNKINEENPDVTMILGDHCHGDRGMLRKLFKLYSEIKSPLLLCMGNHDHWASKNQFNDDLDSLEQRRYFINLCDEYEFFNKFRCLENSQVVFNNSIAFVGGSMWYDYSFRAKEFSEDSCIQKKVSYIEDGFSQTMIWMDSEYVKMPYSDKSFCDLELARLEAQLKAVQGKTIIAGTHFIPFKECVTSIGKPQWDYFNAFMGSEKIGELLVKYNVKVSLFGHSHSDSVEIGRDFMVNGIEAHNVAYSKAKPYLTLELEKQ